MELTAQDLINNNLLNIEFCERKGSDIERHAKGRKIYIVNYRRKYNKGIETYEVTICFDFPNQSASIGWFNASDLIYNGNKQQWADS